MHNSTSNIYVTIFSSLGVALFIIRALPSNGPYVTPPYTSLWWLVDMTSNTRFPIRGLVGFFYLTLAGEF